MQSILSFGAHAFPDVPSRNCPKSQCSSWRFAPVPPVRTGRGYGVDTGPLPAAGAAWSGAAQDAVTGGGRRAWKADCTQRPYTRLRGSAGAGWSGAARDDVAGGCGGGADSDCAQRPYTRLRRSAGAGWSGAARDDVAGGGGGVADSDCAQRPYTRLRGSAGAGWSGALRYGVARGCGGARIRTTRNDPIRGCVGRPGGLVGCRARRRGWRLWRGADSDCAQRPYTRLHGSAGAGWSGAAWDSAAGGCGGARNANCAQRPYTRLCGPAGRDGRGPRGTARQAVGRSAKCELRATTLYGVCGWAASQLGGRPGRRGFRLWRATECEPPATTLYAAVQVGRVGLVGPAPESGAGGCGQAPNAGFVQRPYSGASASRRWTERTRPRSAGKRRWIPAFDSALPRWRWVAHVRKIAPRKDATQRGAVA